MYNENQVRKVILRALKIKNAIRHYRMTNVQGKSSEKGNFVNMHMQVTCYRPLPILQTSVTFFIRHLFFLSIPQNRAYFYL
ncbi:hypothetical protein HanRHA438_Chr07g0306901 [Helianthus annuus]|nr:hypothetical protein HanRHA438_Chr07g0306901 [Helianthus annuus]